MLVKVFPPGGSFRKTCAYLCQDQTRAQVLHQEGVRANDHRQMAEDFEMISQLRPGREHPVFHCVLDFHKNEKPDDARLVEIAQSYLHQLEYANTQYAIVKHSDTQHLHIHLVANRIDYQGEYIQNHQEIARSRKIVNELVQEYDLIPARGKDLSQTNKQSLNGTDARKYAIYEQITRALPFCETIEQLQYNLKQEGIEMRLHTDPDTGNRNGVGFRYRGIAFSGSEIDHSCSLPNLERSLGKSQELTPWEQEQLTLQRQQQKELRKTQEQELYLKQSQRQSIFPIRVRDIDEHELRHRQTHSPSF